MLPKPKSGNNKKPSQKKKDGPTDFGGFKAQDLDEFQAHADEIKALAAGRDFVEGTPSDVEKRPPAFDRLELQVVRSWCQSQPLETKRPAAAMIPYPRKWNERRGRYAKFTAPGGGVFALLRARPTF